MPVPVHVHAHVHVHVHVHVHAHVPVRVCVHLHVGVHVHVRLHVPAHACACACGCGRECACACARACACHVHVHAGVLRMCYVEWCSWAEARLKIARMTLTIKRDGNWSSFQLANSALPLSVTSSAIAPSARIKGRLNWQHCHAQVPSMRVLQTLMTS